MENPEYQANTYTYLYATAKWLKEQPIPPEFPGYAKYRRIAFLTFIAFTVEAFLNHCGTKCVSWWEKAERTLSVDAKLTIVLEAAKIEADYGSEPLQSIQKVLKLRNDLAHGKTEVGVLEPTDIAAMCAMESLTSWGKKMAHLDDEQVFQSLNELSNKLWKNLNLGSHPSPFGIMASRIRDTK